MSDGNRRFVEQLKATQKALGTSLASGPGTGEDDLHYAYMRGTVLVRAQDVDAAVDHLNDTGRGAQWARKDPSAARAGVHRITVGDRQVFAPDDGLGNPVGEDQDVIDALQALNSRSAVGYRATRNHVVSITNANMCPADEPALPTGPLSLMTPDIPNHVKGPDVLIVDTGLVTDPVEPFLWVHGRLRQTPLDADGYIREYVGHGTFIAELLAGVAPGANVWVSNLLPDLGAAFDDEFAKRLMQALNDFAADHDDRWPDIISLSAGSTVNDLDAEPLGHKSFLDRLDEHPETLLVAAAGNNGSAVPFYPAALARTPDQPGRDNIVSVGALRRDGTDRACFSDFGPWVRVYAPGERLVAGFLDAPLKYQHTTTECCRFLPPGRRYDHCTCTTPPHVGQLPDHDNPSTVDFDDLAEWSGTSFATPLVAGMVARAMATTMAGVAAPAVARDLIEGGVPCTIEGGKTRALFPDNYTGPRPTG